MKKVICIWGGHASGKTHFVKEFMKKHNFQGLVCHDGYRELSGKKEEKAKNLRRMLERQKDILMEGMKLPISLIQPLITWTVEMNYKLLLIIVVMSPFRMIANLKDRKVKNGKGWTEKDEKVRGKKECFYEGGVRHLRHCAKVFESTDIRDSVEFEVFRLSDKFGDFTVYSKVEQTVKEFLFGD